MRGRKHSYLGINIEILDDKRVVIDMREQIKEIVLAFGEDVSTIVSSPASRHLMQVNESGIPLDPKKAETYHSLVAKLLYLKKRARPDIEPTVAFLCTRVSSPDEDDWKKLRRVMCYLNQTVDDLRYLGCSNLNSVFTWVDAAYAVHPNMRSHTGGATSLGWGIIHSKSSKQKLNTKSSTEAELVGVSEYLPHNIWLINFMKEQGYKVGHNVIYQDNQSAIRMEKNSRNSCTGNLRHIDIRYFFVKDQINKGEVTVDYCPTYQMLADFFTKPLQGKLFGAYRDVIMGWKHIDTLKSLSLHTMKEHVEKMSEELIIVSKDSDHTKNNGGARKVTFATYADIIKGSKNIKKIPVTNFEKRSHNIYPHYSALS